MLHPPPLLSASSPDAKLKILDAHIDLAAQTSGPERAITIGDGQTVGGRAVIIADDIHVFHY